MGTALRGGAFVYMIMLALYESSACPFEALFSIPGAMAALLIYRWNARRAKLELPVQVEVAQD